MKIIHYDDDSSAAEELPSLRFLSGGSWRNQKKLSQDEFRKRVQIILDNVEKHPGVLSLVKKALEKNKFIRVEFVDDQSMLSKGSWSSSSHKIEIAIGLEKPLDYLGTFVWEMCNAKGEKYPKIDDFINGEAFALQAETIEYENIFNFDQLVKTGIEKFDWPKDTDYSYKTEGTFEEYLESAKRPKEDYNWLSHFELYMLNYYERKEDCSKINTNWQESISEKLEEIAKKQKALEEKQNKGLLSPENFDKEMTEVLGENEKLETRRKEAQAEHLKLEIELPSIKEKIRSMKEAVEKRKEVAPKIEALFSLFFEKVTVLNSLNSTLYEKIKENVDESIRHSLSLIRNDCEGRLNKTFIQLLGAKVDIRTLGNQDLGKELYETWSTLTTEYKNLEKNSQSPSAPLIIPAFKQKMELEKSKEQENLELPSTSKVASYDLSKN